MGVVQGAVLKVAEAQMRKSIVVIAALACVQPLSAQQPSADSAAIVALELEMNRLLAQGNIDAYAAHLTSDYARTTRQGILERRDAALASWRARGPAGRAQPVDLWVRVYGDAAVLTGAIAGPDPSAPQVRITKMFVRQHGRWRLAALHGSEIPRR